MVINYKQQIGNKSLTSYLNINNDFEGLLRKRILTREEKELVTIYLDNPQGLTDNQTSTLTGLKVDSIRHYRESIDKKLGTHLIVNSKQNFWSINKYNNYNGEKNE